MALPLLAVVGSILGSWAWGAVAVAFALAVFARSWRVSLCVLLCAAVSGMHGMLRERNGDILRALPESEEPVLVGTVSRTFAHSYIVQPPGVSPSVYVYGDSFVRIGDVVRVRVVPEPPFEAPPVPGMFDRAAWLRGIGVGAVCRSVGEQRLGHPFSWAALRGAGLAVRQHLAARLMPPERENDPRRQVLCALLLGAKDLAEEETMDSFRRGGCLHAFAVSGMHVGIVAGLLLALFRLLRLRPSLVRMLLPVVVGAYILMTGCAVSALRAYLMGVALWCGPLLRRRLSPANTWCAAACVILLLRPYELWDAGFLLSFAVYAAIAAGLRLCMHHDKPWFGPDDYIPYRVLNRAELRFKCGEQWLRGIVVVSLCAWLVSLPITFLCFHTLTPWSVLTNIAVALPIMVTMCCGMVLLLLSGVPVLGAAAAWAADSAAGLLLAIVGFFGSLPGAYLPAELPQSPDAVAVYELGYGKSCVVLGNPGIVIGCGGESQARYTTVPALFHAGFAPAAVLQTRPAEENALPLLLRQWPHLRVLQGGTPMRFETRAGRFTLYPAPEGLPRTPQENKLPYILWEHEGKRTLYVGDAAAAVAETIPPEERHADVLILGAHPTMPLEDAEDIAAWGAAEIRLLPSARHRRAQAEAGAQRR